MTWELITNASKSSLNVYTDVSKWTKDLLFLHQCFIYESSEVSLETVWMHMLV